MKSRLKQLLKIYKNFSLPVKASFWFVICNCIQKATQIITTPIYTRILTTSQYGEYTVFFSWVELIIILTSLDIFYSGYSVGMDKFKEDRQRYTTSMHGLCFTLTLIWMLIIIFFSKDISNFMGITELQLIVLIVYMLFYPILQFWIARKKYDYDYRKLIIVIFGMSVLTIITGAGAACIFNDKSNAVIISRVIVESIIAIIIFFINIKDLKNLYNKFYWKYALKFNIPLIPHYFSTMILNHSDRIMILNICGSTEAGIYSVAYSIAMVMTIIINAINSAIIPWLYKKLSQKIYDGISQIFVSIVLLEGVISLLLVFLAPEIVKILSTSLYIGAIYVIPPVALGIYFSGIYGLFVNIELYYEKKKLVAIGSMIAAITNIVLNSIFIKTIGYLAAGYTTCVSYFLLTVIHFIGVKRVCQLKKIDFNKLFDITKVNIMFISFIIFTIICMLFYKYTLLRYLFVILILILILIYRKKIKKIILSIIKR